MNPIHFYIVIPVYKAEKYLSACLNSVLNQSYPHFTAVAVDDGSPDRSGEICDEFAAKDNRIHVIHQKNGGSFAARAAGIRWCLENGTEDDFLMSLDSDDCYYPYTLQKVCEAIESHECDMVFYRNDWNYCGKIFPAADAPPVWVGYTESRRQFFRLVFCRSSFNGLYTKAIRLSCIAKSDLVEPLFLRVSEDLMQSIPIYRRAQRPYFLPDSLYCYNYRPDSATNNNTFEHFINPLPVCRIVWDAMEEEGVWEKDDFVKYAQHCHGILNETIWRIARIRTSYSNKIALYDEIPGMPVFHKIMEFAPQKEFFLRLFCAKQFLLLHLAGTVCKSLGNIRRYIRKITQKQIQ